MFSRPLAWVLLIVWKKRPKKRLCKVARILSKIIVGLLALWAASAFIAELLGVTFFFPFNVVERQEVPYHRLTSLRLSIMLTFIYFAIRYIFLQSEKLYPIQFLDIYIKSFTISCLLTHTFVILMHKQNELFQITNNPFSSAFQASLNWSQISKWQSKWSERRWKRIDACECVGWKEESASHSTLILACKMRCCKFSYLFFEGDASGINLDSQVCMISVTSRAQEFCYKVMMFKKWKTSF